MSRARDEKWRPANQAWVRAELPHAVGEVLRIAAAEPLIHGVGWGITSSALEGKL